MSNGRLVRKDVDALSNSEPEALRKLRNAYSQMMQIRDYRGYNYWAGIHGNPQGYCWHGPRPFSQSWHPSLRLDYDLWLPWHRAYLLYFEHYLRDQQTDPDVGVPWWDWSSDQTLAVGVPPAFSAEAVDDQPNPLYKAHIRSTDYVASPEDRDTRRFPGNPSEIRRFLLEHITRLIGDKDEELPLYKRLVTALLSITQFEGLTGFSQTLLDIHNRFHGWTGGILLEDGNPVPGDMRLVGTAAYDPIFWSHHCMLDRLWYIWQIKNGLNNIPADHLPVVLQPFGLTVRDVLDIEALGYEYAVSAEVIAGGPG